MRSGDGTGGGRRTGLALLLLRVAGRLVPAGRRREWLDEWTGELCAWAEEGRPANGPALGAFKHGLWLRGEAWTMDMTHLVRDVRFAVRALVRRPAFALAAGLTLTLGIGATTAVYTIVDGVLMAPLPYPGGERFARVQATYKPWDMQHVDLTPTLLTEWRSRTRSLDMWEGYEVRERNLVGGGPPVVIETAEVTAGFLGDLLGVEPLVGRLFDPSEGGDGGRGDVALVSERLWRSRFGGGTDVLGRTVRLDDRPVTIVGVLPTVVLLPATDVWVPHPMAVDYEHQRLGGPVTVAHLAPGVTVEDALAELRTVADAAAGAHDIFKSWAPEVRDFRTTLVADVRTHLLLLMGAVAAVLLIACVNVANLLLARGLERTHEMALRRSLGAGTGHLMSQALMEGSILGIVGGLGGALVALFSVGGLMRLVPAEIPLSSTVAPDRRVLAFAAALTVGVGLLVGLAPALRAMGRAGPAPGSRRASPNRRQRRAGRFLLGLEVAQACTLLVAAGLMLNTLYRMNTAPAGFDPEGLMFVHLNLPSYAYDSDVDSGARTRFLDELTRRVRALSGVRAVGVGSATPFSGMTFMAGLEQEGGVRPGAGDGGLKVFDPESRQLIYFSRLHVGPSYLSTLGLPVVEGRSFEQADYGSPEVVGLVNETAARAYWPDEDPLGKRVRQGEDDPWITVVGVVRNLEHPALESAGLAELYLPLSRAEAAEVQRPDLLVRYQGDADVVVERVRGAVWEVDPDLPIPAASTAEEEMGAQLAVPRFYSVLLGIFAALALVLASVGTYGVMAHSVGRRTREMGIRLALGASAGRVGASVFGDGMTVVVMGLVVGLAGAALASRLLADLLYEIRPTDPWTYGAVALVLAAVAALAVWIPARRAMKADPVEALRVE